MGTLMTITAKFESIELGVMAIVFKNIFEGITDFRVKLYDIDAQEDIPVLKIFKIESEANDYAKSCVLN